MIRRCLDWRVTPIFIPPRRPHRNGAVENFKGGFQPRLFQRQFKYPAVLRRELARLRITVNEQHVQPRSGQQTVTQYRRGNRRHKLPAQFTLNLEHLPITEGRVIFIRWITARGKILWLGQTFRVGQGHKYHYAKVILDTRWRRLTVDVVGQGFKRWPYKLSQP